MTTYTFVPKPSTELVNWDDPSAWAGMVVPDAPDADVVFPYVTTPSTGFIYTSDVTIQASETYAIRSVSDTGAYLIVDGGLSISGALDLYQSTEVDLVGGMLSFGSLASTAFDIQGFGQVTTPGTLTNTQEIIGGGSGLTVTAASLLNPGSLIASAGSLTIVLTGGNAGSDFAGGTLTGGLYQTLYGGELTLDTGAAITSIAATVELDETTSSPGTGDIQSYDPTTSATLPLEQTLQSVQSSGLLVLQGNAAFSATHGLTDAGTISPEAGALATPGLTVTPSGQILGYGTVTGPLQNNGLVEAGPPQMVNGLSGSQTLVLSGAVTGTGSLAVASYANNAASSEASNTQWTLELGGSDTENVSFGDGTGTLVLDDPAAFTGSIAVKPTAAVLFGGFRNTNVQLFDDTVVLEGAAYSTVTGTSFAPSATGGTLTIQEGVGQQVLTFVGSGLTAASFGLSAGPQALSSSPPSIKLVVTPAPSTPTLTVLSGGTKAIVNTATPALTGTTAAGTTITLSDTGAALGMGALTYPNGESATASYTSSPSPGLGLGFQQVSAVAANAGGTAVSGPISLDVLPTPVNGVTAAAITSLDVSKLFGQGYGLQFVSNTEVVQLTNGALSVGPDTTQALVQRLYEGLLGRPGDAFGLAGFNAQLASGGSPAAVATAIVAGSEYQALHGTQTDTQFVTSLYQGFLGRAPDQPNLTGWVNVLAQGSSRGQVAASFAQSPEAKTNLAATTAHVWVPDPQSALVTELYETGLGRAPDLPDLQAWKQQLTAGLTPQQLAQGIASSAEFNADHAGSSYPDFVTSLYQAGLGRAPAPGEVQGWVGQLQAGASPASVLYGIATSGEAATHLLPPI